jgi:hypothetical protein
MDLTKCTLVSAIVFFTLPRALDSTELHGVKAARLQIIIILFLIFNFLAGTSMIVIDIVANFFIKFINLLKKIGVGQP